MPKIISADNENDGDLFHYFHYFHWKSSDFVALHAHFLEFPFILFLRHVRIISQVCVA